ncbi:Sad1 / UNC-like protein [Nitzschia inconspicua]|uniref:Sad1 / UNC-like protein n=1 Tax=Nitzschia inconspicua TaxID=303405 RepID=A0A9K3KZ92_9STRA|nr:Sad1 / UNC-like protein [Nitzschia inconspicua]
MTFRDLSKMDFISSNPYATIAILDGNVILYSLVVLPFPVTMVREMLPSRSCCPPAVWTFAIRIVRAVRTIASLRAVHDTCPDDALSTSSETGLHDLEDPRALESCSVGTETSAEEVLICTEEHHDHASDAITEDVTNSSVIMAYLHLVVAFGMDGPFVEEPDEHQFVQDDYDDETLSVSSLPKIPLHQALKTVPNDFPAIFDNYDYDNEGASSIPPFYPPQRLLSAARYLSPTSLEDEWDGIDTCRRRLPSMPLTRTSSSTSNQQQQQDRSKSRLPSCRVRPESKNASTPKYSSTLDRLEARLHSYIESILPGYGDSGVKEEQEQQICEKDYAAEDQWQEDYNPFPAATDEEQNADNVVVENKETIIKQPEYEPFVYEDYPLDDTGVELLLEELSEQTRQRKQNDVITPSEDQSATLDREAAPALTKTNGNTTEKELEHDFHGLQLNETDVVAGGSADMVVGALNSNDTSILRTHLSSNSSDNATAVEMSQDVQEALSVASEKQASDEEEDEMLYERVSVDYASKSAGALIIEKSQNFKGTSNLLNGDRDKYAIAPCSEEKKSVVLSLSEDILVKVIKIANYERFSSTVKDFQVLGSQTLGKWVDLGTYYAQPGHGEQIFPLKNPSWARYLKFKFLTHHGVEYYCTLSQIKVHGSTMVQGFHEQWEMIEDEKDDAEDATKRTFDTGRSNALENASSADSGINTQPTRDPEDNKDPSVSHDSLPSVLNNFESSKKLLQMLGGDVPDDEAVSEFYNHIPSVLGAIPAISRSFARFSVRDSKSACKHKITMLAVQPMHSNVERSCGKAMNSLPGNEVAAMIVPKMNDLSSDFLQQRFGVGLPKGIAVNLGYPLPPILDASERQDPDEASVSGNGESELPSDGSSNLDHQITISAEEVLSPEGVENASESHVSDQQVGVLSNFESNEALDDAIFKLLRDLPSAHCLGDLNFTQFKANVTAARKVSGQGASQGGGMMEPIFKKLMDEIFALQTSLSVHDQFAKASVACYQRVLLDLAMEMEKVREDHEERLERLEKKMQEPSVVRFVSAIFQLLATCLVWIIRSLPDWYTVAKSDIAIPLWKWFQAQAVVVIRDLSHFWQQAEIFMESFDNSTRLNRTLNTVLEFVDGFVDRFSTVPDQGSRHDFDPASTARLFSAWSPRAEGGIWAYPIVPLFLLLLACRIFMCCTSSSSTSSMGRTYTSLRSKELRKRSTSTNAATMFRSNISPSPSSEASSDRKDGNERKSQSPTSKESAINDTSLPTNEEADGSNLVCEGRSVDAVECHENGNFINGGGAVAVSPTIVSDNED